MISDFNELAACYEFIDGLPRGLAEKRARADMEKQSAAVVVISPGDLPSLTVEKIEFAILYHRPWLRLNVLQKRFNPHKLIVEMRRFAHAIPRWAVDQGNSILIGGTYWQCRWHSKNKIEFMPVKSDQK